MAHRMVLLIIFHQKQFGAKNENQK